MRERERQKEGEKEDHEKPNGDGIPPTHTKTHGSLAPAVSMRKNSKKIKSKWRDVRHSIFLIFSWPFQLELHMKKNWRRVVEGLEPMMNGEYNEMVGKIKDTVS